MRPSLHLAWAHQLPIQRFLIHLILEYPSSHLTIFTLKTNYYTENYFLKNAEFLYLYYILRFFVEINS